jgi:hypothetical protein
MNDSTSAADMHKKMSFYCLCIEYFVFEYFVLSNLTAQSSRWLPHQSKGLIGNLLDAH